MKKLNLRKLDIEELSLPESTFRQGMIVGCAIVAIPFILVLVWWVHRPLISSEGDHLQAQIEAPTTR
jgi:hypothetical protein